MKANRRRKRKGKADFPLCYGPVRIYKSERTKAGRVYQEFAVVWATGNPEKPRERRFFASLDEAKAEASLAETKIANGDVAVLSLTGADRAIYLDAKARADALGKSLSTVMQEYEHAFKRLGDMGGIAEAVDYYVRNYDRKISPKPLPEVADELAAEKKAMGMSDAYLETLGKHLRYIKTAFPQRIDHVTRDALERFLRTEGRSARYRNNLRGTLVTLFKFAQDRGNLSRDRITEADRLGRARERKEEVEIFTPAEARKLLDWYAENRPDLVPMLAIGLFAGARTAEIKRLDWSDVRIDRGHILLAAEKTKTRQRRLTPIQPVLAAWLARYSKKQGPVVPIKEPDNRFKKWAERAGVAWKQNAMRHSYISYRIAVVKNDHQVASEAGNSASEVHRSYREIVTEADANAWWALFPPDSLGEVIPIAPPASETAPAAKEPPANPLSAANQS